MRALKDLILYEWTHEAEEGGVGHPYDRGHTVACRSILDRAV